MRVLKYLVFSIILCSAFSCKHAGPPAYFETDIQTNWQFKSINDNSWMTATIPGCILGDLIRNGIIDSSLEKNSESEINRILSETWEYKVSFDIPPTILKFHKIKLRFDQIEPAASIFLNDSLILKTVNSNLHYDFECENFVKEKNNIIRIVIPGSDSIGKRYLDDFGCIRYAPFQKGWDAGPSIPVKGIHKPVKLIAYSNANISSVYLKPIEVNKEIARYTVRLEIETWKEGDYELTFKIGGRVVSQTFDVNLKKGTSIKNYDFNINQPELWWCNGLGKPALYQFYVSLLKNSKIISSKTERFGIRKLELVQTADSTGVPFYFKLNDVKIFSKGAVVVPAYKTFLNKNIDEDKQLVETAVASNMNMLRIWGGGYYGDDELLNACDENGILVWQDVMLNTPEDSFCIKNLTDELIQNSKRLRNHPSLALWCNETKSVFIRSRKPLNKTQLRQKARTIRYFNQRCSKILDSISPHTPVYISGNNQNERNKYYTHNWGVWYNTSPFTSYDDNNIRFLNEFGMQSCPDLKTLNKLIPVDSLVNVPLEFLPTELGKIPWIHPVLNNYQRILEYEQMYYNEPRNLESYVYLSQVLQAEALKYAIQSMRIKQPGCMGTIFWQLNNSWPSTSWSTIDYYNNWKPALYTVRKAYQNINVIPQEQDGKVKIWAVNDSTIDIKGNIHVVLMDFDGNIKWQSNREVVIPAQSAQPIWKINEDNICRQTDKNKEFIYIQMNIGNRKAAENCFYFTDPLYLDLPVPDITYTITPLIEDFELNLTSDKLAKNVVLSTYQKDAVISDNNFDLLPGKSYSIKIKYPGSKSELENDLSVFSLVDSY